MSGGESIDATVTEFLELEAELEAGTKTARTYEEGIVAHASKVSAEKVPEDYPLEIRTPDALELGMAVEDGRTIPTYLEWPDGEADSDQLFRLLDALGRNPGEFADLFGDRVVLDAADGWHYVDVEETAAIYGVRKATRDSSLDTTRNLLVGVVLAGMAGLLLTPSFGGLGSSLVAIAWIAIPLLIYVDCRRIERASGWSPNAAGWLLPGLLPLVNPVVGAAYLLDRHVRLSGVAPGDLSETWRNAIVVAAILPIVAFGSVFVFPNLAAATLLLAWTFLPVAVSIDARYVDAATDWNQNPWVWTVAVALTGTFGAIVYLLLRRRA